MRVPKQILVFCFTKGKMCVIMALSSKKQEGKNSKMKKILSILALILVLVVALASCKGDENANNDVTTPEVTEVTTSTTLEETTLESPEELFPTSQGLAYTVNEDGKTCTVTGIGTCTDSDIIIPYTYEGKAVTGIGHSAFSGLSTVQSVTVPMYCVW